MVREVSGVVEKVRNSTEDSVGAQTGRHVVGSQREEERERLARLGLASAERGDGELGVLRYHLGVPDG